MKGIELNTMIKTQKGICTIFFARYLFLLWAPSDLLHTNLGAKIRSSPERDRDRHTHTRTETPHALPLCSPPQASLADRPEELPVRLSLSVGFLLSPSRIKLAHCCHPTSVGAT